MADQKVDGENPPQPQSPPQQQGHRNEGDDVDTLITMLETAFNELQEIAGGSPRFSRQTDQEDDEPEHQHQGMCTDVSGDLEKHAREFMEAAEKVQLYFDNLKRKDDQKTTTEKLRKEIALMEEELKVKTKLIQKHEALIQNWREQLKARSDKHNADLERT